MPLLSPNQLTELRGQTEANRAPISHTKPQVNAVCQAAEDWFEANRAALNTALEAAAPGVFSLVQKRVIVKAWLRQKFERGG